MSTKRELRERILNLEGRLRLETAYIDNLSTELKRLRKSLSNALTKEEYLVRKGLVLEEVITEGKIDILKVQDYCNCPCKGGAR